MYIYIVIYIYTYSILYVHLYTVYDDDDDRMMMDAVRMGGDCGDLHGLDPLDVMVDVVIVD